MADEITPPEGKPADSPASPPPPPPADKPGAKPPENHADALAGISRRVSALEGVKGKAGRVGVGVIMLASAATIAVIGGIFYVVHLALKRRRS